MGFFKRRTRKAIGHSIVFSGIGSYVQEESSRFYRDYPNPHARPPHLELVYERGDELFYDKLISVKLKDGLSGWKTELSFSQSGEPIIRLVDCHDRTIKFKLNDDTRMAQLFKIISWVCLSDYQLHCLKEKAGMIASRLEETKMAFHSTTVEECRHDVMRLAMMSAQSLVDSR